MTKYPQLRLMVIPEVVKEPNGLVVEDILEIEYLILY